MQPGEPYPSLSLLCTSAPALTSAIAVSVWPFCDAKCSAVHLHSRNTETAAPAAPTRSRRIVLPEPWQPNDTSMQPGDPYPSLALQCTSAPALTSAIAVSVWPVSDAECSAVLLYNQTSHS
jgi:hypothetical protein